MTYIFFYPSITSYERESHMERELDLLSLDDSYMAPNSSRSERSSSGKRSQIASTFLFGDVVNKFNSPPITGSKVRGEIR